jgi:hypothetical protein
LWFNENGHLDKGDTIEEEVSYDDREPQDLYGRVQTGGGPPGHGAALWCGRNRPKLGHSCQYALPIETGIYRQHSGGFSWQWPPDTGAKRTPAAPRRGQAAADGAGYVKKSHVLLYQRAELRSACMAQHHAQWPGAVWWEVLAVSRSGFYAYLQRQVFGSAEHHELAL